jgi:hypothetical protein
LGFDFCIGFRRGREAYGEGVEVLRWKAGGFDFLIRLECAALNRRAIVDDCLWRMSSTALGNEEQSRDHLERGGVFTGPRRICRWAVRL